MCTPNTAPDTRFSRSFFLISTALFLLSAACSAQVTVTTETRPDEPDAVREPLQDNESGKSLENLKTFRGLLSARNGELFLTLCGRDAPLPLRDGTDGQMEAALERFAPETSGPVFVELRGEVPSPGLGPTVRELLHASAVEESLGCRERFAEFAFRARGNEPGWSVIATPGELVLTTMEQPEPRRFTGVTATFTGDDADYAGHGIRLSLRRGICLDAMTGEQFGWRAEAVVGSVTYAGCAVRGDL